MAHQISIKTTQVDIINCHLYVCASNDLFVYDLNGTLMRSYLNCHEACVTACTFSASSKLIITASDDGTIKVWSLSGDLIHTLTGHTKQVNCLLISPHDANTFISSSMDGMIRIWSLDAMQSLYEYDICIKHRKDGTFSNWWFLGRNQAKYSFKLKILNDFLNTF